MKNTAIILITALAAVAFPDEEALLQAHANVFRTDMKTLNIATAHGDTVIFRNNPGEEEGLNMAFYYLKDYLPQQNFWTVEMHGYEWMEWEVVSGNNGTVTTTIGPPIPSPDGTKLLCMMDDIDAGYIYNGIQIWSICDNDSLILEFEDLDVPWGPINGLWQDDETISFDKWAYNYDTYEYYSLPGKLKLTEAGTWEPPDPEDWE